MTTPDPLPLVLLVVGTDHHPFDRAVTWVDAWAGRHRPAARSVIQFGTSVHPTHAQGHDVLPIDELQILMSEATVVVCHGGPSTIMGARDAGMVPIVIPRRSELGEHVDDHQVQFATRLGAAGQVHLARTQEDLDGLLDRALVGEPEFRVDRDVEDPAAVAVAMFSELVDQMMARSPRRRG